MKGVVIDVGNSAAKWALLTGQELTVSRHEVQGQTWLDLARQIARKIEDELQYPGHIRVTMVRENRFVEYAK